VRRAPPALGRQRKGGEPEVEEAPVQIEDAAGEDEPGDDRDGPDAAADKG
jgi:hypothetical protein